MGLVRAHQQKNLSVQDIKQSNLKYYSFKFESPMVFLPAFVEYHLTHYTNPEMRKLAVTLGYSASHFKVNSKYKYHLSKKTIAVSCQVVLS